MISTSRYSALFIALVAALSCVVLHQRTSTFVHGFSTTTLAAGATRSHCMASHRQQNDPFVAARESTTRLFSSTVVEGIGEEGCNLPSVSGINTKDELTQAFVVKAVFLSLGAATYLFSSGLAGLESFGEANFASQYEFFRATWPISFGLIFSLAGVTHFTVKEEYENIVPTKGAWGVWNIPGSKSFHVAWTGVAELAGGLGLLAGGLSHWITSLSSILPSLTSAGLESDAAAALFVLTLAVTPANIFMYTHGAKLPMDSDPLPLQFHAVRWVMQVVLLGFLYQIGQETFGVVFS